MLTFLEYWCWGRKPDGVPPEYWHYTKTYRGVCSALGLVASLLILNWFLTGVRSPWGTVFFSISTLGIVVTPRILKRKLFSAIADRDFLVCLECGYDLRHLDNDRCPECGVRYDAEEVVRTWKHWSTRKLK